MSDYFRIIKDGEKQPQATADNIDWDYFNKLKAEYEVNLKKDNAEIERKKIEIQEIQKIIPVSLFCFVYLDVCK